MKNEKTADQHEISAKKVLNFDERSVSVLHITRTLANGTTPFPDFRYISPAVWTNCA